MIGAAGAEKPLADMRLLVVEDEYLIAEELEQMLSEAGAEVVGPCATIEDAIRNISNETISGALLDLNLRGRMAYPVAEELDERNIPFIFVTGYDAPAIEAPFRNRPRLDKPIASYALIALASRFR